ncbi:hypothetical protein PO124_28975 [Bacillus licheniformis]|nr:hypothetical protein [Bacillus licheniformis]
MKLVSRAGNVQVNINTACKQGNSLVAWLQAKAAHKEVVHLCKGISTDETQRVKPSRECWQIAEHPLVDVAFIDRSRYITYVEREGFITHANLIVSAVLSMFQYMANMNIKDPVSWNDAVEID